MSASNKRICDVCGKESSVNTFLDKGWIFISYSEYRYSTGEAYIQDTLRMTLGYAFNYNKDFCSISCFEKHIKKEV